MLWISLPHPLQQKFNLQEWKQFLAGFRVFSEIEAVGFVWLGQFPHHAPGVYHFKKYIMPH